MPSDERFSREHDADEPPFREPASDGFDDLERAPLEQRAARYRLLVDRLVERLDPPASS